VWCSPDFYRLTGYCAAEILGRNCRFLQCEETDQEEIDKMREGIKAVCTVTYLRSVLLLAPNSLSRDISAVRGSASSIN
jgi:hypothetical protein